MDVDSFAPAAEEFANATDGPASRRIDSNGKARASACPLRGCVSKPLATGMTVPHHACGVALDVPFAKERHHEHHEGRRLPRHESDCDRRTADPYAARRRVAPYESIYAGLGNQRIVTTLCPRGKERVRRLMEMVAHQRVDLTPLVTHRVPLDDVEEAFDLFSHLRGSVLEVALHPASPLAAALQAGSVAHVDGR